MAIQRSFQQIFVTVGDDTHRLSLPVIEFDVPCGCGKLGRGL